MRLYLQRFQRRMAEWWLEVYELLTETVIMPDSKFAKMWERLVLLVTLIISFFYPYCASFIGK